jgi:hypothetical protein
MARRGLVPADADRLIRLGKQPSEDARRDPDEAEAIVARKNVCNRHFPRKEN